MTHGYAHPHVHDDQPAPDGATDLTVPDGELEPGALSRRQMLRNAGLLGAGAAAASGLGGTATSAAAPAQQPTSAGVRWLAGDHHIHTQYSGDAIYRVIDEVRHGRAYGLDWMVITDHGGAQHARIGVERVNPDIRAARNALPDVLVFHGLEWNIPGAEHATVFVHPCDREVSVLKQFENDYDGSVVGAGAGTPHNEALAIAGLTFLADAVRTRQVTDAIFLANHPARRGVDSPHEIRGWRDAAPTIAVGFEGAPGHQAAGIPQPPGLGSGRGFYAGGPGPDSFPGYPTESYRTWGGFDWMTATVGGLWDSLLAEGKPWWISANSDAHFVYLDTAVRGLGSDFNANGFYQDPVHGTEPNTGAGDFWPGYYSRTHVGARKVDYAGVMDGLRAGRVWVDHGNLVEALDVRARIRGDKRGVPLGGVLRVRRGQQAELDIVIDPAVLPNWAQFVPQLARIDVVRGAVTGPAADRDSFSAPGTSVVESFDVSGRTGRIRLTYRLGSVEEPFYVRLRGTDGNRSAVGPRGAAVDPHGPAVDVLGDADPWVDLWLYTNPIWVLPG
ncbi:MAG: histidinol-phosphatase [Jiangellaceae bacterium]